MAKDRSESRVKRLSGEHTIGPYSDAISIGDLVFLSGRVGLDYETMQLVPGGIEAETRRCRENVADVLRAAGPSLGRAIKTTVFLTDTADFSAMNSVYAEVFGEHRPARSTVAVAGLPMTARVEIEVIAERGR